MALAFDAASSFNMGTIPSSPQTWSHTCSGSDRILIVGIDYESGSISGVTYNGTSMTFVRGENEANVSYTALYYLVNPAAGTNTISVSLSGVTYGIGGAVSLSGAKQSGQPDANAGNVAAGGTSPSTTITTVADKSWVIDTFDSTAAAASPSGTQRWNIDANTHGGGSTSGPKTPAGNVTMSWSGNGTWAQSVLSVAPYTGSFPDTTGATLTGFSTSVTSMAVNLPGSITSGDLLIAIAEVRNSGTWTLPTGWTQLFAPVAAGGVGDFTAFYRICDGTEGASATWTASVSTTASWQVRRITNWHGTTPPEAATANSGGSISTNDPPSLTPSWGADNTLWLAVMGNTAQSVSITAVPTNYDDLATNAVSTGGSACNTGSAFRQLNASSENPVGFSTGSDRWWMAATIAIRPVAAAGSTIFNHSLFGRQAVNRSNTY